MRTQFAIVILVAEVSTRAWAGYDPLAVDKAAPEHKDLVVKDQKRRREIPIQVYLPKSKSPAPVVLFSHGLGGSRTGSAYLGNHWALCGSRRRVSATSRKRRLGVEGQAARPADVSA